MISTRGNTRHLVESEKEIERLRFELSRKGAGLVVSDKQIEASLEALRQIISAIQRMKDEILIMMGRRGRQTEYADELVQIKIARESLFDCYEEQFPYLNSDEASIAHKAKNMALEIEATVDKIQKLSLLETNDEETVTRHWELLQQMRYMLTDLQNLLRESRIARITSLQS